MHKLSPHPDFGSSTTVETLTFGSNAEFWWALFSEHGDRSKPYTVEAITASQRIVFTADEENVKAILATQFSDYGKGPQFRKEWKDFLGLSMMRVRRRWKSSVDNDHRHLHDRR